MRRNLGVPFYKILLIQKSEKMKTLSLVLTLLALFASFDHLSYLRDKNSFLNINSREVVIFWLLHLLGIIFIEVEKLIKQKIHRKKTENETKM